MGVLLVPQALEQKPLSGASPLSEQSRDFRWTAHLMVLPLAGLHWKRLDLVVWLDDDANSQQTG